VHDITLKMPSLEDVFVHRILARERAEAGQ
jgi:hypothetical protein